jgi:hypothetical protein
VGGLPGLKGIGRSGEVFKILFNLDVRNEWMSINDFHELGLKCSCLGGR